MGYTDLWHCKQCGHMPEIFMLGKNFFVRCNHCNSEKVNVYANNIDEAVALWNKVNDPAFLTFGERLKRFFRRK